MVGDNELWGPDWAEVRDLWPLDRAVTHLNHGSFGAVPAPVADEQGRWRGMVESNANRFFERVLEPEMSAVRDRVGEFVGADPARLVLTPNVTMAIAGVLASTPLESGDEVLVTSHVYSGVRAAAGEACRRAGAELRIAPLGIDLLADAPATVEAVLGQCSGRTRLAIVEHVTSPTAAVIDVGAMVAALRDRGVPVLVDGAHAPGALELSVDAIGADYYAGTLHKWCCAPVGAAFIAVAPERVAGYHGAVPGARSTAGFPAGLEWWGTADYTALLSVPAGLALLRRLGVERVRAHNVALAAWGRDLLQGALRTAPVACRHASMTLVGLPDGVATTLVDARALRQVLAEAHGIETMVVAHEGRGYLRLSAYVYNAPADYRRLATAVTGVLGGSPGQGA